MRRQWKQDKTTADSSIYETTISICSSHNTCDTKYAMKKIQRSKSYIFFLCCLTTLVLTLLLAAGVRSGWPQISNHLRVPNIPSHMAKFEQWLNTPDESEAPEITLQKLKYQYDHTPPELTDQRVWLVHDMIAVSNAANLNELPDNTRLFIENLRK